MYASLGRELPLDAELGSPSIHPKGQAVVVAYAHREVNSRALVKSSNRLPPMHRHQDVCSRSQYQREHSRVHDPNG